MFEGEYLDLRPTISTVWRPIVSVKPTPSGVRKRNAGRRLPSCRLF